MDLNWAGQNWRLLGERALLWRERETLIFSDVHLGKAEDFQAGGRPVPSAVHDEDLRRMASLILAHRPRRVLVLGDFVHSNRADHPRLAAEFKRIRALVPCSWILLLGNHDRRHSHRLKQWCFDEILAEWLEDDILFTHNDHPSGAAFQVSGHVHPVLKLVTARDRLRLPCFVVNPGRVLLPAFGTFTGGYEVTPTKEDRLYIVADQEVMAWT